MWQAIEIILDVAVFLIIIGFLRSANATLDDHEKRLTALEREGRDDWWQRPR